MSKKNVTRSTKSSKRSVAPASCTKTLPPAAPSPAMTLAEAERIVLASETSIVAWRKTDDASLLSLICTALADVSRPNRFDVEAAELLGDELHCLYEAMQSETAEGSNVIPDVLFRLSDRARAVAEIGRRIREARALALGSDARAMAARAEGGAA
jgi:hypothetical protein